jgi:hypothetical protein
MALYGTLGSHLRDVLQEGGAAVVAYVPAPRAWASLLPFNSRCIKKKMLVLKNNPSAFIVIKYWLLF